MTAEDGGGGLESLVALIDAQARLHDSDRAGTRQFVNELASRCAGIHLENFPRRPVRFLREMQDNPPLRMGTAGFRSDVVDDHNPARHYMAFVFVGYYLPRLLAAAVLYLWEIASLVRYKGRWSGKDVQSGFIGIAHGRAVAQQGAHVLAGLVRRDLSA